MAIEINTATEFMALYNLPEESRGTADNLLEININADLDFSEIENAPDTVYFYANLNGNGHTFKNIAWSETKQVIFFGFRAGSASGITFDNCTISVTGAQNYIFRQYLDTVSLSFSLSEIVLNNNCKFIAVNNYCSLLFTHNALRVDVKKIIISGNWSARYLYLFMHEGDGNCKYCYQHIGANIVGSGNGTNATFFLVKPNSYSTIFGTYIYNVSTLSNFLGNNTCAGFMEKSYVTIYLSYSYSSMELIGNTNKWYQTVSNWSSGTLYSYCVFSNSDKLGSTANSTSATTEQLKSVEWLRSQGWVI